MSRGGGSFNCFNWSFKAISAEIVFNLPRLPKIGALLLERNRRTLTQGRGDNILWPLFTGAKVNYQIFNFSAN